MWITSLSWTNFRPVTNSFSFGYKQKTLGRHLMLFARWRHYFPRLIQINYGMMFRMKRTWLICAKFGKDLFNISKVIGRKSGSFFWLTVYILTEHTSNLSHGNLLYSLVTTVTSRYVLISFMDIKFSVFTEDLPGNIIYSLIVIALVRNDTILSSENTILDRFTVKRCGILTDKRPTKEVPSVMHTNGISDHQYQHLRRNNVFWASDYIWQSQLTPIRYVTRYAIKVLTV